MRAQHATFAALLFAGCSSATPSDVPDRVPDPDPVGETGARYITIDTDALDTARAVLAQRSPGSRLEVIEQQKGVAVVSYDAQDFGALSTMMHERHNRCGGFALHESLDEAVGVLRAREHERVASLVSYTIDNAATVNALVPNLDKAKILATIQELSGMPTRRHNTAGGQQASTFLRDRWATFTTNRPDVTLELFTHTQTQQKSVIATIPGSTLANEVVVVGGHLDSISSTSSAPGADDDASGIATLTEVFRVLMAQNYRPQRTVKFMAYAAEEVGLVGSKSIVQDHVARAVNVVGVMQLDMTNFKGSALDIYFMQDFTNAAQNTFVGQLIDTYLPGITRGTDSCGYGCSDHASWHNAGFPTSMPFESRMNEHNPQIHTPSDTLALSNNNADHAVKFAKMAAAYVAELAKGQIGDGPPPPPPPPPVELFRDNFETATNWSPTGLWHLATNSTCAPPGYSSATRSMYFGSDALCNYSNGGARASGAITSPSITGVQSTSKLSFKFFRRVESDGGNFDVAAVDVVSGTTATTIWTRNSAQASTPSWGDSGAIALSAFAGQTIQLRFRFDSMDATANTFTGWLVDDVVVTR